MPSLIVSNFNLKHTLECGQFFLYEKVGKWYYVQSGNTLFRVRQDGVLLYFEGCSTNFLKRFFAIDFSYESILLAISKDSQMQEIISKYGGLRIIRQDPWECLISFVCSSMSNVKRIQQNIFSLAKSCGRPIKLGNHEGFLFPEPGEITVQGAKLARLGFRERYVLGINEQVTKKSIHSLCKKSYEDAKVELMELPGVGEKIAECVLLFGFGHTSAFPVDVWIQRVMEELYFQGKNTPIKVVAEFGKHYFGMNAGYAQQFLYHWRRNHE